MRLKELKNVMPDLISLPQHV